ncbi:MAG: hypothetical protein RLZZ628_2911 [Bacteroidota bacterium]|jgi:hypothetical protein
MEPPFLIQRYMFLIGYATLSGLVLWIFLNAYKIFIFKEYKKI